MRDALSCVLQTLHGCRWREPVEAPREVADARQIHPEQLLALRRSCEARQVAWRPARLGFHPEVSIGVDERGADLIRAVVLGHVQDVRVEQHSVARARHDACNSGRTGKRGPVRVDVSGRKMLTPRNEGQAPLFGEQVFEKNVQFYQEVRRMGMIYAQHVHDVGMEGAGECGSWIEQPGNRFVERQIFPDRHPQERKESRQVDEIDEDRIGVQYGRQVDETGPGAETLLGRGRMTVARSKEGLAYAFDQGGIEQSRQVYVTLAVELQFQVKQVIRAIHRVQ